MAAPVRSLSRRLSGWPTNAWGPIAWRAALGLGVGVPLLWATALAVQAAGDASAWRALWTDPQTGPALALSLWTGLASTALSVALAAWLLGLAFGSRHWARCVQTLGPMLALPHAAFAIGLAFLLAPSGWVLRALSPWATGFETPPPWPTTQDPWGLGLIAALVLKEVPFLLWVGASELQRPEVAERRRREWQLARSLGHSRSSAWWRVVWPAIWPRWWAPLAAVGVYGLTVVDMALVIGPGQPPTLATLAWQWLQDPDPVANAQGVAAAWALTGLAALATGLVWWVGRSGALQRTVRDWLTRGPTPDQRHPAADPAPSARNTGDRRWLGTWGALWGVYGAVWLALALGSVAGVWPFPHWWPESWSGAAWATVWQSRAALADTLGLGLLSATLALLWAVAWLEWAHGTAPAARAQGATWALRWWWLWPLTLPLALPGLLWAVGLQRLALATGLDGQWLAVGLAHTLLALPYALIALAPSYLGFDPRAAQVAASLGRSRGAFLWRIKWPLLKAPLAAAWAVALAVSVAQYLPTVFVGAGRVATVTTEALALSAGGQRALAAAYAWLQWGLPALAFAAAAWWGRPRHWGGPTAAPAHP